MKTLAVLFGLVGAGLCYPWGTPQQVRDTPEVEAAKAAHLAAHAQARHSGATWGAQDRSWSGPEDDGAWKPELYGDGNWRSDDEQGRDSDDGRSWSNDGRSWSDDSDDGSYKDEGSWRNYDDGSYKDEGSWRNYDDGSYKGDDGSWNHQSTGGHWDVHERKWTGPVALPPGYDKNGAPLPVQDTPEVAAAKSKHFHLYHAAAHGTHSHY